MVGYFQGLMQKAMESYMQGQEQPEGEQATQELMAEAQQNIPEELKRIQKYFEYDFQDMNESSAHKLLTYLDRQTRKRPRK